MSDWWNSKNWHSKFSRFPINETPPQSLVGISETIKLAQSLLEVPSGDQSNCHNIKVVKRVCWIHWNHYVPLTSNVSPVINIDIVCYIMIIQHCMHLCNTRYSRYTTFKYIPSYINLGPCPRYISGPLDTLPYYTHDYSSLLSAIKQCAMYRYMPTITAACYQAMRYV